MDFQLHQLSTSNLASIFNSAFMDAEALEDSTFCTFKGDSLCLYIYPVIDNDLIRFASYIQLPESFKEEDETRFLQILNNCLHYAKAIRCSNEKDEKQRSILFEYEYPVFKGQSISPKTLVKLARTFEKTVLDSGRLYHQSFAQAENK